MGNFGGGNGGGVGKMSAKLGNRNQRKEVPCIKPEVNQVNLNEQLNDNFIVYCRFWSFRACSRKRFNFRSLPKMLRWCH